MEKVELLDNSGKDSTLLIVVCSSFFWLRRVRRDLGRLRHCTHLVKLNGFELGPSLAGNGAVLLEDAITEYAVS